MYTLDIPLLTGGVIFYHQLTGAKAVITDPIDLLRDSVRKVKRLYPFHIDA